jgi:hypothetical protein
MVPLPEDDFHGFIGSWADETVQEFDFANSWDVPDLGNPQDWDFLFRQ